MCFVYLDPDYFLEIRIVSQRTEHGAQVEVETDLGDYEKVDGVFVSVLDRVRTQGQRPTNKRSFSKRRRRNSRSTTRFSHFPVAANNLK